MGGAAPHHVAVVARVSPGVCVVVGAAVVFRKEGVGDGGGLASGVAPDGSETAVVLALAVGSADVGGDVVVVGVGCEPYGAAGAGGA